MEKSRKPVLEGALGVTIGFSSFVVGWLGLSYYDILPEKYDIVDRDLFGKDALSYVVEDPISPNFSIPTVHDSNNFYRDSDFRNPRVDNSFIIPPKY